MTNPNSTIDRSLSTFRRALHRFHRNKVLGFFTLAGFGFGGVKFIFWARNDLPILAMIWVTAILLAGIFIGKKKFVFVVETSDTHQLTVPVSALYVFDHRTEANRFRERLFHYLSFAASLPLFALIGYVETFETAPALGGFPLYYGIILCLGLSTLFQILRRNYSATQKAGYLFLTRSSLNVLSRFGKNRGTIEAAELVAFESDSIRDSDNQITYFGYRFVSPYLSGELRVSIPLDRNSIFHTVMTDASIPIRKSNAASSVISV
jgi:hypothetical protein